LTAIFQSPEYCAGAFIPYFARASAWEKVEQDLLERH